MIGSVGMIVVQNRNRRTGKRRTFQIAEITPEGDPRILLHYDVRKDVLEQFSNSEFIIKKLELYTGLSSDQVSADLKQKMQILNWMLRKDIENIQEIGKIMSKYYLGKLVLD